MAQTPRRRYEAVSSRTGSARLSGMRVGREVRLAATSIGDVRVSLRRREVGVAEHLLHGAEVGPSLEQVRREGVAEEVGVDALGLEPCLRGELAQDQERAGAGQRPAAGVEEQVGPVAAVEVRSAERQVAAYRLGGRAAERDDALLVALAEHAHDAGVDVDRRAGETDRLRDSEARRRTSARRGRGRACARASSRLPPRSAARTRRATACAAACGSAAASRPRRRGCRRGGRAAPGGGRTSVRPRSAGRSSTARGLPHASRRPSPRATRRRGRGRRVEERGERCEVAAVGVDGSRRPLCGEEEQ